MWAAGPIITTVTTQAWAVPGSHLGSRARQIGWHGREGDEGLPSVGMRSAALAWKGQRLSCVLTDPCQVPCAALVIREGRADWLATGVGGREHSRFLWAWTCPDPCDNDVRLNKVWSAAVVRSPCWSGMDAGRKCR